MRKRAARVAVLTLLGVAAFLVVGCDDSPTVPDGMVDSGSWYRTGFRWAHDGHPYETEHFIVFSDAASFESRRKLGEVAEELMVTLTTDFGVDPQTMFKWPPGQSKLHIYTYRDHYEQSWGGWGYWGGLLIWSLDHPIRSSELSNYRKVVTHELMHAIEGLLKGTDNPKLVDVWLTEGIAEYVAGGTNSVGRIESVAVLDSLVATHGEINPVAMHFYEDYPPGENLGYEYLYAMFELAVRYLLDEGGLGKPASLVRDALVDGGEGVDFATSFQEKFGIDLRQFEDEFWDRVRAFLG